jgi:hypothetical protein
MRPESLLFLLAVSAPLAAEPKDAGENARAAEATPELLEYLGSWETATGSWNETMPDSETTTPPAARRPKEATHDKE